MNDATGDTWEPIGPPQEAQLEWEEFSLTVWTRGKTVLGANIEYTLWHWSVVSAKSGASGDAHSKGTAQSRAKLTAQMFLDWDRFDDQAISRKPEEE